MCFGIGHFKFKSSYLFPGHWSFSSMLRYPCGKRTSTWLHLLHLSYFACHSLWLNIYVKVCFPFSLSVPRDYIPNDIYANIFFPFILLFSFLFFFSVLRKIRLRARKVQLISIQSTLQNISVVSSKWKWNYSRYRLFIRDSVSQFSKLCSRSCLSTMK